MFLWWGRKVVPLRWFLLVLGAAIIAGGAVWGIGAFSALSGGGFDDPASEASRALDRTTAQFGDQSIDLLVVYSDSAATVDDPAFRRGVTAVLAKLGQRREVVHVTSWYQQPPVGSAPVGSAPADSPAAALNDLVSADRHLTYVAVRLRSGSENDKLGDYESLKDLLRAGAPLTTSIGGPVAFLDQVNTQTVADIGRAEMFSMPVLLVLLVLIFRGLVAAFAPLVIGGVAIFGAFMATRLLTAVTDVSVFAINIITLIGMGMAIDYALLIVTRFREELSAGRDTRLAVQVTMATAGRTVVVSGTTVVLALSSLLIFPQFFLRSLGLGGIAAVSIAVIAAITVLPALLAVLGPRINSGALRFPRRRRRTTADAPRHRANVSGGSPCAGQEPGARLPEAVPARVPVPGIWARIAESVMRRPVTYLFAVTVVLLLLAVPFLRIDFGGFDERVLPVGAQARVAADDIRTEFPRGSVAVINVLLSGAGPAATEQVLHQVRVLPGVSGVQVGAARDGSSLLLVNYPGEPTGDAAEGLVRALRKLPVPNGVEVLVGGRTAANLDRLDSLDDRLPWMILIIASSTIVLLFLAFGSVVLPLKAVVMNAVSIGSSFGVVVWVFQDGHFADQLQFTSMGFIEPTSPVLMFAVLFGLSTDYEVFLLSRIREEWDSSGDNTRSVSRGLQHTAKVITAAALLLVVVVAGFAAGDIMVIKMIGVGLIVGIVVDTTLVRALLVPATMRLFGDWNWWAPGPLLKVYRCCHSREADPLTSGH